MTTAPLVKCYAKALADTATETGVYEPIGEDLAIIAGWMRESAELSSVMKNPSVPAHDKSAIIEKIWAAAQKQAMRPQTRQFLQVLMQNKRMNLFLAVQQVYQEIIDQRVGTVGAVIRSSVPLSPEQKNNLIQRFQGIAQARLRASFEQDEGLLGGVIVQIGSTVYDGSVRSQLDSIRKTLCREPSR